MDNDDNTRLIHKDLLERLGVDTHTVKNGQEGLDLIDWGAKQFELILMDRQMPIMDGIKVLHLVFHVNLSSMNILVSSKKYMFVFRFVLSIYTSKIEIVT